MRQNHDKAFVGLESLKQTHRQQISEFESWAAQGKWELFHTSHYDWWVFPIHKPSSYGLAWTIYEGDADILHQDTEFRHNYERGVELVSASWGWDLAGSRLLPNPMPGQCWHHWPVRLFKAALSVHLFGYTGFFNSLKTYAISLMETGEPMEFSGHDLSWLFTTGIDPNP